MLCDGQKSGNDDDDDDCVCACARSSLLNLISVMSVHTFYGTFSFKKENKKNTQRNLDTTQCEKNVVEEVVQTITTIQKFMENVVV